MYQETKELPITESRPVKQPSLLRWWLFRRRISWKVLDALDNPDEIAALLHSQDIRGVHCRPNACALARATGWSVSSDHADKYWFLWKHRFTEAEQTFVKLFDAGFYPNLEQGPWS